MDDITQYKAQAYDLQQKVLRLRGQIAVLDDQIDSGKTTAQSLREQWSMVQLKRLRVEQELLKLIQREDALPGTMAEHYLKEIHTRRDETVQRLWDTTLEAKTIEDQLTGSTSTLDLAVLEQRKLDLEHELKDTEGRLAVFERKLRLAAQAGLV